MEPLEGLEEEQAREPFAGITPQEARARANIWPPAAPRQVYAAVDDLIVENFVNGIARVNQWELINLIAAKCGVSMTLAHAWERRVVPKVYAESGWQVHAEPPQIQALSGGYVCDFKKFYYVFASEPILTDEQVWKKYHPDDAMPVLSHQQAWDLKKLKPGYNGWDKDAESGYTYRTEQKRLGFMERVREMELAQQNRPEPPLLVPIQKYQGK